MLLQIDLVNLITIEKLHLELKPGTTVITGETGAGKSILIDAIELALGGRATTDVVRAGQAKADINITFDLRFLDTAREWLIKHELEDGSDECVIRRTIQKDGKSKCYINGIPSTLPLVRELSDLLINIHGQHEHQSLFKLETQREMLDKFGGHIDLAKQVSKLSHEWHDLNFELRHLQKATSEKNSRCELLRFQLKELETLRLSDSEFAQIETEHKKLANSGELLQKINTALNTLSEDESNNVVRLLNHSLHNLETVQTYDLKLQPIVEALRCAAIQLNDTADELRHHLDSIDLDPERLHWLEQRISSLFNAARKYKVKPEELYSLQQKIVAELNELDNSDERLIALEQKLEEVKSVYTQAATDLSSRRLKASKKLSKEITEIIHELSLSKAKFHIELVKDETQLSPTGYEKIIFQIATNIGHSLQPLAKIASGGELSRVSLAIHLATAEQHTIPTLIFDEVDVGISGGTAEIVGKLLRRLGKTHQLLCITHLPQVAAQGQQHLIATKRHEKNATYTDIRHLEFDEKIQELARMLGGIEITKKTLDHAKEMLEKAKHPMVLLEV